MARATDIVPPRGRVVERRVTRRLKTRRALRVCFGSAASALATALLWSADHHAAPIIVLAGIASISGMTAAVLRFVEEPREVILHEVLYERDPPGVLR